MRQLVVFDRTRHEISRMARIGISGGLPLQEPLHRQRVFRIFLAGETVSALGSQVSAVALPLTAVLALHAHAFQMGVLFAAFSFPYLIVSLPAGAWLDRKRRQPILLAANIGAAAALLVIPVAHWAGVLSIGMLYVVAVVVGSLTVLIGTAYQAFVPAIAARSELVDANTALEASRASARTGGPAVGGLLVQALGAPLAVLFDSFSYLVAVLSIASLGTREDAPAPASRLLAAEIGVGVSAVITDSQLRSNAASSAITNCALAAIDAIFVLYMHNRLHASALLIGLVLAVGNAGFLLGVLAARRSAQRVGSGTSVAIANATTLLGALLLPVLTGPRALAIAVIMLGRALIGAGETVYTINQLSQRQLITPVHLLGRINATVRLLAGAGLTLGALAGGALAAAAGMRLTLIVASLVLVPSIAWAVTAARAESRLAAA